MGRENTITILNSTTGDATPAGDSITLAAGELAINRTDNILFYRNAAGNADSTAILTNAASSPTFAGLTLTGDLAVNGDDITSDGDLNISANNDIYLKEDSTAYAHFDKNGNHFRIKPGIDGGDIQIQNYAGNTVIKAKGDSSKRTELFGDLYIGTGFTAENAELMITAGNDADANLYLQADDSDDPGDDWKIQARASTQALLIMNDIASAGTYVSHMTITPHATITSSVVDIPGSLTLGVPLAVAEGGTALTSLSTLLNSNVTPTTLGLLIGTNTQAYDAQLDTLAGFTAAQVTRGIVDDNLMTVDDADAAANDYAKFTANGLAGRSYSEVRSDLNVEDGATADQTKSDINALDITELGTITSGVWTGTALGASYVPAITSLSGYTAAAYANASSVGATSIVTTGALDAGSITSNFGAINNASTIQGTTITATTAFVPDASDGAALGTSALEFSDLFLADGAVINFGDDQDVTLTHVADTGLLLGGTGKLQFSDSSQYIYAPNGTTLKLYATDEIEFNATAMDINGTADISGTLTLGTVAAAGSDVDKFLVLDGSGNVDYRTGAQTASDIGALALDALSVGSEGAASGDGAVAYNNSTGVFTYTPPGDGTTSVAGLLQMAGTSVVETGSSTTRPPSVAALYAGFSGSANIVTTGALNSGSITSGFTSIDVGAGAIAAGSFDASDGDITNVGNISLDTISGDGDADTIISMGATSNQILFTCGGEAQVYIKDGGIIPDDDNEIDLGSNSVRFKDAYFDGTVTSDAFSGPLTGNVTGNASGSSATCSGLAATATALATARNIGGVSFDGTGNIDLPGVNSAGNQATSGLAATATALASGGTLTFTGDVTGGSTPTYTGGGNLSIAMSVTANSIDGTHLALGSDAEGDVMYYNGTNYIRLAKGTDNHVLTMNGNVPNWETTQSGGSAYDGDIGDLDIDGATDIGAAIVAADLFIVDDGAGGTNRKATGTRVRDFIITNLTADLGLSGTDSPSFLNMTLGADSDTDSALVFGHDSVKSIIGVDESSSAFCINTDASFESGNDFEIDTSGNVTLSHGSIIVANGEVKTPTIAFSDGDNAITIADGGACTFPQAITASSTYTGGGTMTTGGNIVIPANGYIGVVGDTDMIYMNQTNSKVEINDALKVAGDIDMTGHLYLNAAKKVIFDDDHSDHTYIQQSSADVLDFCVGGDADMLRLDEGNAVITVGSGNDLKVTLADKLILDDDDDSYLQCSADDVLEIYTAGSERLQISSTGVITFNNAFAFPNADGSADQVLKTNGSGTLTWQDDDDSGGGGGGYSDGDTIKFADGSAGTPGLSLNSDANTGFYDTGTTDELGFSAGGVGQIILDNGAIKPVTDNDIDLGHSSYEFKDAFFDGTVYADEVEVIASYSYINSSGVCRMVGYQAGTTSGINSSSTYIGLGGEFTVESVAGLIYTNNVLFPSDSALKTNISNYDTGLSLINQLQPKNYTLLEKVGAKHSDRIGFIAQDLQSINSDFTSTFTLEADGEDYLEMSVQFRDELLVAQVNAIKELSAKNDALEARIAALEA
jgi:hypothetical protein